MESRGIDPLELIKDRPLLTSALSFFRTSTYPRMGREANYRICLVLPGTVLDMWYGEGPTVSTMGLGNPPHKLGVNFRTFGAFRERLT